MGVNTRLSMKFVLASLCISIALLQVAHATTTCSLPDGTYFNSAVSTCESYADTPTNNKYCEAADVTSLKCRSGASGTPAVANLACATDKGKFTGATFCTFVQVGITAKFTGVTSTKMTQGAGLLSTLLATQLKEICGSTGDRQCTANDIKADVVTRRADTTIRIRVATSTASAPTALASLYTIDNAASLTAIKALANGDFKPFTDVTLITITKGGTRVNGVLSSASSVFHFSFLATAMSVAAMVYSKL